MVDMQENRATEGRSDDAAETHFARCARLDAVRAAGAFGDDAVALTDFERGKIGERIFQQFARIELRWVLRPAGLVFELLRRVAL